MNNIKLKLGKMTAKELAQWFGMTYDGFRHGKKKKLETLKLYADFHIEGRYVIIDNIKHEEYIKMKDYVINKALRDEDREWQSNGLDTSVRVGKALHNKDELIHNQISEKTTITYVQKGKTEDYGRNYIDEHGLRGSCQWVWACFENGIPRYLTEKEQKILKECRKEAFSEIDEMEDYSLILMDAYSKGEIPKEEMGKSFEDFLKKFKMEAKLSLFLIKATEKLGFEPKRATKLIEEINFN